MTISKTVVAVLLLAFSIPAGAADRKYIAHPQSADAKPLPFSDAVVVGNTLYIAGHIGLDPKTGLAPADAEQEAHLVMDSVKKTVESAGFSMDDLVSVQIFCTDLKFYDTFNAVYKTYFHGDYPARAFVGIDKLLRNGRYEVMGIAVKRSH
jgi:2-iminobutanoate/2-iminopropanoate deaminase